MLLLLNYPGNPLNEANGKYSPFLRRHTLEIVPVLSPLASRVCPRTVPALSPKEEAHEYEPRRNGRHQ